jgi:hypothetical protein
MNKNIKTITILKYLFKRPITLIINILNKLKLLTAKGFISIFLRIFKYIGLIFAFLSYYVMYRYEINLKDYLSITWIAISGLIGRFLKNLNHYIAKLNEWVSVIPESTETVKTPTKNSSPVNLEEGGRYIDEWMKTMEKYKKIKEQYPNEPEKVTESLRDLYMRPSETNVDDSWLNFYKNHPYLTAAFIGGVGLIIAIYTNSDGSLESMGGVTKDGVTTVGKGIAAAVTSVATYLYNLYPRATITHESEEGLSNNTQTFSGENSYTSYLKNLSKLDVLKHHADILAEKHVKETELTKFNLDTDEYRELSKEILQLEEKSKVCNEYLTKLLNNNTILSGLIETIKHPTTWFRPRDGLIETSNILSEKTDEININDKRTESNNENEVNSPGSLHNMGSVLPPRSPDQDEWSRHRESLRSPSLSTGETSSPASSSGTVTPGNKPAPLGSALGLTNLPDENLNNQNSNPLSDTSNKEYKPATSKIAVGLAGFDVWETKLNLRKIESLFEYSKKASLDDLKLNFKKVSLSKLYKIHNLFENPETQETILPNGFEDYLKERELEEFSKIADDRLPIDFHSRDILIDLVEVAEENGKEIPEFIKKYIQPKVSPCLDAPNILETIKNSSLDELRTLFSNKTYEDLELYTDKFPEDSVPENFYTLMQELAYKTLTIQDIKDFYDDLGLEGLKNIRDFFIDKNQPTPQILLDFIKEKTDTIDENPLKNVGLLFLGNSLKDKFKEIEQKEIKKYFIYSSNYKECNSLVFFNEILNGLSLHDLLKLKMKYINSNKGVPEFLELMIIEKKTNYKEIIYNEYNLVPVLKVINPYSNKILSIERDDISTDDENNLEVLRDDYNTLQILEKVDYRQLVYYRSLFILKGEIVPSEVQYIIDQYENNSPNKVYYYIKNSNFTPLNTMKYQL